MTEENSEFDSFEMQLNNTSISFLDAAGRWAYFLGIVGFNFSGLMLIVSVFIGIAFSAFSPEDFGEAFGGSVMPLSGGAIAAIYVLLGLVYGVFSYYPFQFWIQDETCAASQ